MTLTGMLNSAKPEDKKFQNILRNIAPEKDEFETISGNDAFNGAKEYTTFVPYQRTTNYQSSITGIAFDYLARFLIASFVPSNCNEVMTNLNAKRGLKRVNDHLERRNQGELSLQLKQKYDEAIQKCVQFTHGDCSLDDIIPPAILLGKLERTIRDVEALLNVEQTFFGNEDKTMTMELKSMSKVFQEKFMIPEIVTSESNVVYNPNFGIAGVYVSGADADIIIDGVLYDFKTSERCNRKWQEVAQLIGYYYINEISVEKGGFYEDLGIHRVAFYRARFGEIEYFDTDIFLGKVTLPAQVLKRVNGELIIDEDYISLEDLTSLMNKTVREQTIEDLLSCLK